MDKPQIPLFGPISEHEDVSKFDTISKRTILLPSASFEEEKQDFSFSKHILFRFFILSQRTSYSTQLLVSWGLIIPAIALNRVRLEQLIVSSYLIHEDADKGINPFVKHMPIANFENIKAAWSDAKVAEILKQDINIDGLEKEAANAISDFSIEFKFSPEKTKKKWTSLDLRSMAKRRDLLTKSLNRISEISLERFYITIYKDLSSVIHCNSLALSPSFLGKVTLNSNSYPVLVPNFNWAKIISAQNALFDIIQTFEIMKFIGIDCYSDFSNLLDQWNQARDKYI